MELTIDKVVGIIVVGLLLWLMAEILASSKKKKKTKDVNIEWYGPEVYLKKKDYGEVKDDYREKIIEKE